MEKKIIHVDADCFFAAVEMLERPELKDVPMAIGGGKRGVLSTSNYKAREFGIRSAMPVSTARKKCPQLVLIPGNYEKYKTYSKMIMDIFLRYTPHVQALSLDEAYLDVTEYLGDFKYATELASSLREEIFRETGLTVSAGIAPNKLLAKIASDINKPNGQFTVAPWQIESFIAPLSVKKLWGVGQKTYEKMQSLNLETCADLQKLSRSDLEFYFGSFGNSLYDFCRGVDDRDVRPDRVRKSWGMERTFSFDIETADDARQIFRDLCDQYLEEFNQEEHPHIKGLFVKIKFFDFRQTTIEHHYKEPSVENFMKLFDEKIEQSFAPIRLLGLGVKFAVSDEDEHQLSFELDDL